MLIDLFRTHAGSRSSGTALLVFENKSLGKIYFSDGRPVSARYLNEQGQEAVDSMEQRSIQSSVFHQNIDAVLSTSPLLLERQIDGGQVNPETAAPPISRRPADTRTIGALTPVQKEEIAAYLAHYIGPVAHIMLTQQDPHAGVSDTINTFVENITDPVEAKSFILMVKQVLKTKM